MPPLQLRKSQGYNHVRLVCPKEDYILLRRLYDFTKEVLEAAGTGEAGGLQAWKMVEYAQK
jgi:hypothetical protein